MSKMLHSSLNPQPFVTLCRNTTRHPSSHCQHESISRQRHSLSVRPFPFTLPNVRLTISSPQSCTSNGDKHTINSPNEITCQSPPCSVTSLGLSRAYSNGHVSFWPISILTPCTNAKWCE
jgi:hypothetical protein